MTVQITVIGLNRIGLSLGLSLEEHKTNVYRCGFDSTSARLKQAESIGAFDKHFHRLIESIREAEVVILSIPVEQIEETLKELSEDLKPGAIVINTTPAITFFSDKAKNLLSPNHHTISMIPSLNGLYLNENVTEAQIPHADLFKNAEVLIPTDDETHSDAVRMVTDLAAIIGATPCFIDPVEAEGILTKTEILPRLAASALLLSTLGQPGWQDARKVASVAYTKASSAIQLSAEEAHPADLLLTNRQNMLFALDGLMASIAQIRGLVENGEHDQLDHLLSDLRESHAEWMDLRINGDWDAAPKDESRKAPSLLGRLFGDPSKLKKK